ncbi:hypothetical protein WR25_24382, partial [Diploscapter pachys]
QMEVVELRQEIKKLREELEQNDADMKKMEKQITDSESRRMEIVKKQIENENEVYDEKAAAEANQEKKLDQLEGDPKHVAVEEEKGVGAEPVQRGGGKVAIVAEVLGKTTAMPLDVCGIRNNYSRVTSDVQMLDVYDKIEFDNPDGGVWKQGFDITYDSKKVEKEKKLEVFVIPHSHNDPGWVKTFDDYYNGQTKHILSGMAKHLPQKDGMRFIYAEMSFFEMWWSQQSEEVRETVRKLLKSGQFEIVTGGWVMTDEANAHYHSIVVELFEGHEFIRNQIDKDYKPSSHWSIDPFGLSPVIPHIVSAANITKAALQRQLIHYSVKKYMAKTQQLEFYWRQLFGSHSQKDVLASVFPFYSYDIPHTCGPDPKICCQFDFARLPGGNKHCDWGIPPQTIRDNNIQERAQMIYDQYRKKSQLFKTNVLFVPLGDDFRYETDFEWNNQYENYQKLFSYMNNYAAWNVHARFGTLSDYFNALEKELQEESQTLPVLSGDFFTYADRDDHYWSGYYTSRPFYKQADRTLQHALRSAEIAFTLASAEGEDLKDETFALLVEARRALSLFQHHDGVTGTAKDFVMEDYGSRMLKALKNCEKVLAASLSSLLEDPSSLTLDEIREAQDALIKKRVFDIGQRVVVFNSLTRSRNEPICIRVKSKSAKVKGEIDAIEQQISPVVELDSQADELKMSQHYELCFLPTLLPFGISTFQIIDSPLGSVPEAVVSGKKDKGFSGFVFKQISDGSFKLDNSKIDAEFDGSTGLLKSVKPNIDGAGKTDINAHFIHYGARGKGHVKNKGGDDLSGAYLFLPNGDARNLSMQQDEFFVVDGPLVKRVYTVLSKNPSIFQISSIFKDDYSVDIQTRVDIRQRNDNFELGMRFITSIQNNDDFYTDLNGMQSKLPLQANFYPMPASAFIEDSTSRLSLLGSQALGVASLKSGYLEVMLDRRLQQDDNRGLFQPVVDNKPTVSKFRLLVEPLSSPNQDKDSRIGFLSPVGFSLSMLLHYPHVIMMSDSTTTPISVKTVDDKGLHCDLHAVTLRTLSQPKDYNSNTVKAQHSAALILHRTVTDCRSKLPLENSCRNAPLEASQSIDRVKVEPEMISTVKVGW